jgi:adenosine deaminase
MRERDVMVEINLSSNDVILGVRGKHHPFELYRRAGVPVALSTDDEGVSRVDLTHEFQRAVETYDLSYADIKGLARNSLTYNFLPGDSLWQDSRRGVMVVPCADAPQGANDMSQHKGCADFLARSEKARQQWRLESEFAAFERSIAAGP